MEDVPSDANQGCPGTKSGNAGKSETCKGCPNQQICATAKPDLSIPQIKEKLSSIKHKIFVLSGKGGVGKSTVSTQLAVLLSQMKISVGLLDVDICGPSVPTMLGLVGQEIRQSAQGWSPVYKNDYLAVMSIGFLLSNQNQAVIWRGPRKNGLIKQFLNEVAWEELDYLIIDTPPGTSDEHITLIEYLGCTKDDGAIIVTTPQQVSLSDVRKEISFCRKTKINILGVVENMSKFVCPHCKCESPMFVPTTGGAKTMCEQTNTKLLVSIPLDPRVVELTDKGLSVLQAEQSNPARQAYTKLANEIKQYKW